MPKPNPDKFAVGVLAQLASLRGEMAQLRLLVADLSARLTNRDYTTMASFEKKTADEIRDYTFRKTILEAGIDHPERPPKP